MGIEEHGWVTIDAVADGDDPEALIEALELLGAQNVSGYSAGMP